MVIDYLKNTSVTISWQSRKSNFTVWFAIECSTAETGSTACKDVIYSPIATNITSRKVDLKKLQPYTTYKFTVYAKNALSEKLPKKFWPNEIISFKTHPGRKCPLFSTDIVGLWAILMFSSSLLVL